jgi:hypothetical protein
MKSRTIILIALLLAVSLSIPCTSQAWRGHGHGGRYGWYGGAFVGGALLGSVLARPWYAPPYYYSPYYNPYYPPAPVVYGYPPPPVYAYPPAAPVYTQPPQAYAYPDPASPQGRNSGNPAGEWVTVPGQSINGIWVPSHRAWVPVNP